MYGMSFVFTMLLEVWTQVKEWLIKPTYLTECYAKKKRHFHTYTSYCHDDDASSFTPSLTPTLTPTFTLTFTVHSHSLDIGGWWSRHETAKSCIS